MLRPIGSGQIRSIISVFTLPRQSHYPRYKLVALSAIRQSHDGTTIEQVSTQKSRLAHRIRGLHERARPFALPNLISATRLLLAPTTGYFILHDMNSYALTCVAVATVSDVADKAAAKLLKYTSGIQPTIDLIADKVFLMTTMCCLYTVGYMPVWFLKALFFREFVYAVGAIGVRYFSFGDQITIKKFFDVHNYPTFGLEPKIPGRVVTGSQYLIYSHYLHQASIGAAAQLHDGWGIIGVEGLIAFVSNVSIVFAHIKHHLYPSFYCRPIKQ